MSVSRDVIDEFVTGCHMAATQGLMRCSSGNISTRISDELMLITASRSWLETLTPNQVSVCSIKRCELIEGAKPSVETGFHAGIMNARSDVGAVIHFQTPFATTLACRNNNENINYFIIPEIPFYIGQIATVPFLQPGSEELQRAVIDAALNHNMVVLNNHGLVTTGKTLELAIQNAVFFELACELIVRNGKDARYLSDDDVEILINSSLSRDGKV